MKKFESGQAILFVIVILIIGLVIHGSRKDGDTQVVHINSVTPATQPPHPTPTVTISKIWPDGSTPTKIVHVPDAQHPTKGLMEITLHQGDDLELDVDSLWILHTEAAEVFQGAEVAVNSGNGFEPNQEFHDYIRNSDQTGTNAYWMKGRILRVRLAPDKPSTTYDFTVIKMEIPKPLPPILPQNFHDLSISYGGIRGLPQRKALIYLSFRNNSAVNTLAVAMHDQGCIAMPCVLQSSLVASDGTPYVIDTGGITGISGMRTDPRLLTSIEPGQELKTSLTFEPRGIITSYNKSARLQMEVVVNENFRNGEYDNYRVTGRDVLPPYCKIINVIFDIPLRP